MTKASSLVDLLARVRAFTGPDRALDGAIFRVISDPKAQIGIPPLTASVDAALALVERVLPGWRVQKISQAGALSKDGLDRGMWACELWQDRRAGSGTGRLGAPTLPRAILAALLTALEGRE